MTLVTLIAQGIRYHRRLYLGLLAGVVIACAALTGALAVGDSVRQTLFWIAEARLGAVGHALDWGNRYFDAALATAVDAALVETGHIEMSETAHPGIAAVFALRGMAETSPGHAQSGRRLNRAYVYGVDAGFWTLAPEGAAVVAPPGPQEALINESVARTLGLAAGDDMLLRLVRPSAMPLEAPLSRGDEGDTAVARVRVAAVLSEAQWGRFSLVTDQAMPANIFVDQAWLGHLTGMIGKANLLLASDAIDGDLLQDCIAAAWKPEHVGYRFREHPSGIIQLESERLFIESAVTEAAQRAGDARPLLHYLVNEIRTKEHATPYSFVTAGIAPDDTPDGAVCVNQWLADALDLGSGDTVTITWNEPLPSGEFKEHTTEAQVHQVVPMAALQVERDLTLDFPGLSDVDTCRDWDIGLPLDEEKLQDEENEAYWNEYRQTPKLTTSFETGSRWWGSRFGTVMALRFTEKNADVDELSRALRETLDPAVIGLTFMPVRENARRAVEQAMDFGGLFIGMSMFLIAAALTLLALLYAHGLQTRANEIGALLAVGWTPRRVRAWLLLESLPVILCGSVVGAVGGLWYARLLLFGLTQFWPDAVAGAPLRFHLVPATLVQGAVSAALCVFAVILICSIRACRRPARELLQRDFASTTAAPHTRELPFMFLCAVLLLVLAFSSYQAFFGAGDNPTPWFFASGAAALATALTAYGLFLGRLIRKPAPAHLRLWRLILAQLARRRSRSVGVALVTGCGVFMIVSVFAMQAAMTFDVAQPASGAGGFTVFASLTTPVRGSDDTPLGFSRDSVVPLRVWDGDDAGCLNLNRAQQPRLYGVAPRALSERGAFAPQDAVADLWSLLELPLEDDVIPALVGDTDTALWGLEATTDPVRGAEFEYPGDTGETFRVRAVGRLPMRLSLFQGAMLISEEQFTRMFPHEGGYRAFLVDTDAPEDTAAQLNQEYRRLGMEAAPSVERLRAFYAVERAYLAMFLVLGGIGMMLGAGGAAVIALRNMAERRAEFALLVAVGYEPRLVRRMALLENVFLVVLGILFGLTAAAIAVIPLLMQAPTAANVSALAVMILCVIAAYLAAVLITTRLALGEIPLAALRTE